MPVTGQDVRRVALALPRVTEHLVRDRPKFRVGRLVFVALSADETTMGFGYPKQERAGLVAAEPHKFQLPAGGDLRYNWVLAELAELDPDEMRELVLDAWRMVVPRKVAVEHLGS